MRSPNAIRLLYSATAVVLAACGSDPVACNPTDPGCGPGTPTVATIEVSAPIDSVMAVGRTTQLSAAAADASGSPVSVSFTWSSTVTSVASVSGSGLVTAAGEGSASVEAQADGVVGSWPVRVVDADLDGTTALLSDPFAAALIESLDTTSASAVSQFVTACEGAIAQGDVLLVKACLDDAIGVESSDAAHDPALAVLDLVFQESLRKLRLDG